MRDGNNHRTSQSRPGDTIGRPGFIHSVFGLVCWFVPAFATYLIIRPITPHLHDDSPAAQ
jgi:hypothetical protein